LAHCSKRGPPISLGDFSDSSSPANSTIRKRCAVAAWLLALAAVAIRLPAAIHQCGGQDEDYFSVAGWTLLETGVPSIPYAPSLNEKGVFYKANEILFALPPGFFFAEAAVFKVVGPSYAAGRLTSLLAGAAAIVGVFYLGLRWLQPTSALLAAAIFAFSRPFLFAATTARPDMLCTALLIWAFVALMRIKPEPAAQARGKAEKLLLARRAPSLFAGVLLGLALFTHPFGLLGVLLAMIWIVFSDSDRKRFHLLLLLVGAAAAFALWLPLIAKDPALFRVQFGNNVLNRAGPGLLQRLFWPWETLAYQAKLFFELAGPWQAMLFGFSLLFASERAIFDRRPASLFAPRKVTSSIKATEFAVPFAERKAMIAPRNSGWLWLAWTSVFGLAILQGIHPSKGYWSFPTAFLCFTVAKTIEQLGRRKWFAIVVCLALLIPGGGWKATAVYVRHWGDPAYSHQKAVAELLGKLPPKSRYLVDVGCVFDWHLDGRKTLLALDLPQYYSSAGEPFDFLIVTRTGLEQNLPSALGAGERILQIGDREDELKVYVEVWRR
jgi:4-amino-4-deoxy-L-arabinose transferase-like glycosyltransferase